MGRVILLAVALLLIAGGVGFFALGAFPPDAHPVAVHKLLPNDRFTPKG